MAPPSPGTNSTNHSSSSSSTAGWEQLSKTNLYIRGLPPSTTDHDLVKLCQPWVPFITGDIDQILIYLYSLKIALGCVCFTDESISLPADWFIPKIYADIYVELLRFCQTLKTQWFYVLYFNTSEAMRRLCLKHRLKKRKLMKHFIFGWIVP